jgi:hypothetical protein
MTWEKVRLENLCTIVRGSSPRPQSMQDTMEIFQD